MNKKITILWFSPRKNGNCAKISNYIAEYHTRTNVHMFQITADNYAPCGGCDYQCLTPGAECPTKTAYQTQVMEAACGSDLVYFIVPNFCGYPNANYFAFNERSVGFIQMNRDVLNQYMAVPKRFIIVSNTESENFRNAMQQQTNEEPQILYLKTGKYKLRSTAGNLMESAEARDDLTAFLQRGSE